MKVKLITVGTRMPSWVQAGCEEYGKRIKQDLGFELIEVPLTKRSKASNVESFRKKEAALLLEKIEPADLVIALEVNGKTLDTPGLAAELEKYRTQGVNLSLLVGGPDGLDQSCLQRANVQWSLSRLTLPHPLVRIVLVEQLYRAVSLTKGHPYHRE